MIARPWLKPEANEAVELVLEVRLLSLAIVWHEVCLRYAFSDTQEGMCCEDYRDR